MLLAGNVSSGIEPVFAADATRRVLDRKGETVAFPVTDNAVALWRRMQGRPDGLPLAFVSAPELAAKDHLLMQARLQPFVDNAISKTINLPASRGLRHLCEGVRPCRRAGAEGLHGVPRRA